MRSKQKGDISTLGSKPKISRQVQIPRQQYLIGGKWYRHTPNKGVEYCRQVIDQIR